MKKEIAEIWTKALRSGEYQQIQAALKDNTGYCCLGVLCKLSGLGEFGPEENVGSDENLCRFISTDGISSFSELTPAVMSWSGIKTETGKFIPGENTSLKDWTPRTLAEFNDQRCKSFLEIADIIDENWEKL